MRYAAAVLSVALCAAPVHAQSGAVTAAACTRLAASLSLQKTTITASQVVAAGSFTPPSGGADATRAAASLPAFCRVSLTMTPSSDSDIKAEVWLPMSGWNGKFLEEGNGAWGGSIQYMALGNGLRRGY